MRDRAYWAKLLPVIGAFCSGKECQHRPEPGRAWIRLNPHEPVSWHESSEYRIKPETAMYRRYFYKLGASVFVGSLPNSPEYTTPREMETQFYFIKWIDTEWQEIELPSSTETGG